MPSHAEVALAAILVTNCAQVGGDSAGSQVQAVVKQIDHVMIGTNQFGRLLALLADTLRLPVVWGPPGSDYTDSYGVALGDSHFELMNRDRATDTRLESLAMQPTDIETAQDQLKALGLSPREPFSWSNDAGQKRGTLIGFQHAFEGDGVDYFLVAYHIVNSDARRARFDREFHARQGGPLGLRRVREFRLAYPSSRLALAREGWARLLGPGSSPDSNYFAPRAGAGVRVVRGQGAEASSIVVEVASMSVAEAAARSLRLLQAAFRDSLVLNPDRFGGLRFVLVRQ